MNWTVNLSLAAAVLAASQAALAGQLVTAEEVQASDNAAPVLVMQAAVPDPLAPVITLADLNALNKPLKNPFSMEISFKSQAGAGLDLTSFKAFYGTFKIDITDRLLKEATKTLAGLKLANVEVPAGRHKILLRINDSQGRTTDKELAFQVE